MPSVETMVGLLERLQSRDIVVHQDRCVRVRHKNATCSCCFDACVSGCLSIEDNRLSVDPTRCIGCATCCTACPTDALEARDPDDSMLLKEALRVMEAADGNVVIAPSSLLDRVHGKCDLDKVVRVRNLGRMDETVLIALAMRGAASVTLVLPRDPDAADAKGIETAEAVRDSSNEILEAWGFPMRVRISSTFPSHVRLGSSEFDQAKRGFFKGLRAEAKDVVAVSMDYATEKIETSRNDATSKPALVKVGDDGTLPHGPSEGRRLLLGMLAKKGQPEDVMVDTRLWGHVIIDADRCMGCRMCATFCPTGALTKYASKNGSTGVAHGPARCVKCHCCEDICSRGAIEISDQVFARDVLLGEFDRYEMPPERTSGSNSHSIVDSIRSAFGDANIYER